MLKLIFVLIIALIAYNYWKGWGGKSAAYKLLWQLDDEFTKVASDNSLSEADKKERYRKTLEKLHHFNAQITNEKEAQWRERLMNILERRIRERDN